MQNNIYNLTQEIIQKIKHAKIKTINNQEINIIDEFKKIPRSGKAVRIDKFKLNLPKQSLLDHVFQVALIADFLIEKLGLKVDENFLAHIIACHDLPEVITGDVPDYTENGHFFQKNGGDLKTLEKKTIEIIIEQFSGKTKENFWLAFNNLHSNSKEAIIFHLADKIEPIISIWRYLFFFKDRIDIDIFLEAMIDFFINPKVVNYSFNNKTLRLINYLQSKENAKKYYQNNLIEAQIDLSKNSDIKNLIEFRNIDFI